MCPKLTCFQLLRGPCFVSFLFCFAIFGSFEFYLLIRRFITFDDIFFIEFELALNLQKEQVDV